MQVRSLALPALILFLTTTLFTIPEYYAVVQTPTSASSGQHMVSGRGEHPGCGAAVPDQSALLVGEG